MYTFSLFWNYILVQLFGYRGEVDRFVMLSFIYVLAVFICIKVWKDISAWTFGLQNIMDQFNNHLSKRDEVIQGLRQNFIFEKIKSAFFSMQYFRLNGAEDQIELVKQDLRKFGIKEELINDDKKLYHFLMELQQKKWKVIVDTKNHKFLFQRIQEQDQEDQDQEED